LIGWGARKSGERDERSAGGDDGWPNLLAKCLFFVFWELAYASSDYGERGDEQGYAGEQRVTERREG
jgi:hypothetical protein